MGRDNRPSAANGGAIYTVLQKIGETPQNHAVAGLSACFDLHCYCDLPCYRVSRHNSHEHSSTRVLTSEARVLRFNYDYSYIGLYGFLYYG